MRPFNAVYINPSRRDLLKQLLAMGVIGTTGMLQPALLWGRETRGTLKNDATWRGDVGYEDLRRAMLWKVNTPTRYPDVIAQARNEEEIISALKFASENDLQVVCRTTGHNTAGAILRNGGMMLDISPLDGIEVDADEMTASVQPGARMYPLYERANRHDLAFPTAECETVAVGGYLLGGGVGLNGQHWGQGPACYSVLDADIILANGDKVTVNRDKFPDLYWAIRGVGPGFFGIVTRYRLQLYHTPGRILRNTYVYPATALQEILSTLEEHKDNKDERLELDVVLDQHPASRQEVAARVALTVFADKAKDPEAEARSLLSPYANDLPKGALSSQTHQRLELTDLMFTPPRDERTNVDNVWTDDAKAFLPLVDFYKNKPPGSQPYLNLAYGMNSLPLREDACYSATGRHAINARMKWLDPELDGAIARWYDGFKELMAPHALGHYINEANNEQHKDRVRDSFSQANWQRLAGLRKQYDPDNRFYSYLGYN